MVREPIRTGDCTRDTHTFCGSSKLPRPLPLPLRASPASRWLLVPPRPPDRAGGRRACPPRCRQLSSIPVWELSVVVYLSRQSLGAGAPWKRSGGVLKEFLAHSGELCLCLGPVNSVTRRQRRTGRSRRGAKKGRMGGIFERFCLTISAGPPPRHFYLQPRDCPTRLDSLALLQFPGF